MFLEDRLLRRFLPGHWYEQLNREEGTIREFLHREIPHLPDDGIVLDAGAGEGRYRAFFNGYRYIGVDFGKGDGQWDYSGLDVVGSVLELPFTDNSFDAALCTQVLEHVPRPDRLFRELARVVRPGGTILLTAPLAHGEHQAPYDFFRFTSYGLRELARQASLEVVSLEPRGGYFTYLAAMGMFQTALLPARLMNPVWKVLYLPFRIVLGVLALILGPLIGTLLDKVLWEPAFTLGYAAVLRVPGGEIQLLS